MGAAAEAKKAELKVEAKKAELAKISATIDGHDADFAYRRGILLWLLQHDVSKAECARIMGKTPMAVNYAIDDKRKK